MNRVNMKQTESKRESNNYQANRELADCISQKVFLLNCKEAGTLSTVGKRQLARYEKRIAEIEAETN